MNAKGLLAIYNSAGKTAKGFGTGRMDRMEKPADTEANIVRLNKNGDPLGPNSEIGRKLKQYYEDIVSEDIPDRFSDLLSRLETAERSKNEE